MLSQAVLGDNRRENRRGAKRAWLPHGPRVVYSWLARSGASHHMQQSASVGGSETAKVIIQKLVVAMVLKVKK